MLAANFVVDGVRNFWIDFVERAGERGIFHGFVPDAILLWPGIFCRWLTAVTVWYGVSPTLTRRFIRIDLGGNSFLVFEFKRFRGKVLTTDRFVSTIGIGCPVEREIEFHADVSGVAIQKSGAA